MREFFAARFSKGRAVSVSIRTIATFAVAIFLGIVAVVLTRSYVTPCRTRRRASVASAGLVPVVVAAQPLDRGVVLQPGYLKLVNFPADAAPANAFHAIAELTGGKDQQRLALRSMVANEPILAVQYQRAGRQIESFRHHAAGMRAVSLRSNDVTGVGGFVLPGDRVDVLLTRATGSGNDARQHADPGPGRECPRAGRGPVRQ